MCRLRARPWRCSRQIPVRVAISASVKIFWLDLTLITPLPSFLIFRSEHNSLNDFANLANPPACRSVRLKFEVRVQVAELHPEFAPACVDVGQHKVSRGKTGLP